MKIKSLVIQDNRSFNSDRYQWEVVAQIEMDSTKFNTMKRKGHLGQLFGIDISNMLYDFCPLIPAHNPIVDHQRRASKGIKTIQLNYALGNPEVARQLGCESIGNRAKYGTYVNLLKLRVVA